MAGTMASSPIKQEYEVSLCTVIAVKDIIKLKVSVPSDWCIGEMFNAIRNARYAIGDKDHIAMIDWQKV